MNKRERETGENDREREKPHGSYCHELRVNTLGGSYFHLRRFSSHSFDLSLSLIHSLSLFLVQIKTHTHFESRFRLEILLLGKTIRHTLNSLSLSLSLSLVHKSSLSLSSRHFLFLLFTYTLSLSLYLVHIYSFSLFSCVWVKVCLAASVPWALFNVFHHPLLLVAATLFVP